MWRLCRRSACGVHTRTAVNASVICIEYRILIRQPREFGEPFSGRRFVQARSTEYWRPSLRILTGRQYDYDVFLLI